MVFDLIYCFSFVAMELPETHRTYKYAAGTGTGTVCELVMLCISVPLRILNQIPAVFLYAASLRHFTVNPSLRRQLRGSK